MGMLSSFPLTVGIVIGSQDLMNETISAVAPLPVRVAFEERQIDDWSDFLERLNRVRVDVVIVELQNLRDPLPDVIRQLRSTTGEPMVIVVHPNADADVILKVVRANANEFIYPPMADDLEAALNRMAAERASHQAGTRPRGKVVGFLSAKGGCGATTLACHVAAELRKQTELDVLLADFDLQSGLVGFLMKSETRYSVEDALGNSDRMDLSFWKALVSNGRHGIEVIPAPANPLSPADYRPLDLRNVLRFVRSNYDWVVVDVGRLPSSQFTGVLEEMDHLFVVSTTDIPALHRAKTLRRSLVGDREVEAGDGGIQLILNRVPRRMDMTLTEMERVLGGEIFATVPDDAGALHEAYSDGSLVSSRSKVGKTFRQLTEKISGVKQRDGSKGRFSFGISSKSKKRTPNGGFSILPT